MSMQKLAWVMGAALAVSASGTLVMGSAACSSSSGNGGGSSSGGGSGSSSGGADSSVDSPSGDDGGTSDTGTAADGSGSSSGGGDASACKTPPSLHPGAAGAIFCGYGAGDAGSITCAAGQECCIGNGTSSAGYAPDECSTYGTPCTNSTIDAGGLPVECEQTSDCTVNNGDAGGYVCCLQGVTGGPQPVAGCPGDYKATGGKGVACEQATSCAAGESQVCSADTDCPTGMHCQAFRWKIIQLGYCM